MAQRPGFINKCYLLGLAAALSLGSRLAEMPAGPDAPIGWAAIAGAFLLFLGFALSAFLWGSVITRFLAPDERGGAVSVVTGLGFYALVGELLALAGWIGFFPAPPMLLVLGASALVFSFEPPLAGRASGIHRAWLTLLVPAVGISFFLFARSWIPDAMPDPLWYHLTGARAWSAAGGYDLSGGNAAFFQAGAWDALFFWGNFFLGSPGEGGLIPVQFFGQWLHLLAGLLSGWVLFRLLSSFFPRLSAEGRAATAIAAVLGSAQLATITLAKNDWGATLFLFTGALVLFGGKGAKRALLGGIFLGLAFSTKASVAFAGIPLAVLLAWHRRPAKEFWAGCLLGAVSAAFPWMLRNYVSLGDPFFPALQSLFPARVGPSWQRFSLYYEGARLSWKSYLWRDLLGDSPYAVLAPALLTSALLPRIRRAFPAEFLCCALTSGIAAFFLLKSGAKAEYRLFGAGCLLLIAAGTGFLLTLVERSPLALARRSYVALVVVLGALGFSLASGVFPADAPLRALAQDMPAAQIRSHFGGTALAWIRLSLPAGKKIASANEYRLYYLAGLGVFRIWDIPALDARLYQARSGRKIVAALREDGIDYLIFSRMDWDQLFRKEVLDALEAMAHKHPSALAFMNEETMVIDLSRLQREIGQP